MIESLSLRSTGRTVHLGTIVTPINKEEEAELLEFSKKDRPVCKITGAPEKPAAAAADNKVDDTEADTSNMSPEDPLLAVPGVGKTSFDKLKTLGITNPEQLKEACLNADLYAKLSDAVGAINAAKWKKHFSPDQKGTAGDEGTPMPKSSREQK